MFESLRAVAGSEAGRAGFIAQHADLYEHAIKLSTSGAGCRSLLHQRARPRARAFLDFAGHRRGRTLRQRRGQPAGGRAGSLRRPPGCAGRPRPSPQFSTRQMPPSSPTWRRNWPQPSSRTRPHSTPSPPTAASWRPCGTGRSGVLDLAAIQALLNKRARSSPTGCWAIRAAWPSSSPATVSPRVELPEATSSQSCQRSGQYLAAG